MSTKRDYLLDVCKRAVSEHWQYVYGCKGETATLAKIRALRRQYGSGCVWPSDDKKAGKFCCDCSGLISYATKALRGSYQYRSTALKDLPISSRTSDMEGWAVWMPGHIGIYDGAGGYYAMDGSARNAVHLPLTRNRFTRILKLCDIDYGTGSQPAAVTAYESSLGTYNIKTAELEDDKMNFLFEIGGSYFYMQNYQIVYIANTEELKLIRNLYKKEYGKDITEEHYGKGNSGHVHLKALSKRAGYKIPAQLEKL